MNKLKNTKEKYIKITLHIFNLLTLFVGISLTLFGLFLVAVINYENTYIGFLLQFFTISILLVGIVYVILFIVGLVVLCRENNLGIAIFTVALIVCSLLLLALGIWSNITSTSDKFQFKIYNEVNSSLYLFNETDPLNKFTQRVNLLQTKFKCCGLNGYLEWKYNVLLNKNSVLKKEYLLNPDQIPFDVPDSCCIQQEDKCGKGYISIRNVYTNGCYSLFRDFLVARIRLISIVAIGFSSLTFITIVYLIYAGITTEGKYDMIEKYDRQISE